MGVARQALDGGTGSLRSHTRFDRNACCTFNGLKLGEWSPEAVERYVVADGGHTRRLGESYSESSAESQLNEVEQECIILNSVWGMVDRMVNWATFVKHDRTLPTNMMFETSGHARLFSIDSSSLSALPSSDLQIPGNDDRSVMDYFTRLSKDGSSSDRVIDSFSGTELRGGVIQPKPEGARIAARDMEVEALVGGAAMDEDGERADSRLPATAAPRFLPREVDTADLAKKQRRSRAADGDRRRGAGDVDRRGMPVGQRLAQTGDEIASAGLAYYKPFVGCETENRQAAIVDTVARLRRRRQAERTRCCDREATIGGFAAQGKLDEKRPLGEIDIRRAARRRRQTSERAHGDRRLNHAGALLSDR
jgi:hypothetical protein